MLTRRWEPNLILHTQLRTIYPICTKDTSPFCHGAPMRVGVCAVFDRWRRYLGWLIFQGVAACCSVLQRAAECCRELQCVAVAKIPLRACLSGCCSVLQRVAVRCSELQCVAVPQTPRMACLSGCCSVLQCVAACCSVLQWVVAVGVCVLFDSPIYVFLILPPVCGFCVIMLYIFVAYVCIHIYICYMYWCTQTPICIHTYTYMCMYVHTYIFIYVHIHVDR